MTTFVDTKTKATQEAERILSAHWDGTVPVDPARVATSLGIRVMDAYLDADVAGAIECELGQQPVIYLSATDHPNRKRFTCAHEIGHFIERSEASGPFEYIDYRGDAASMGIDASERFANAFAAALLMPAYEIKRLRDEGWDEEHLAKRFGVSRSAMVNRLKNLGLYR